MSMQRRIQTACGTGVIHHACTAYTALARCNALTSLPQWHALPAGPPAGERDLHWRQGGGHRIRCLLWTEGRDEEWLTGRRTGAGARQVPCRPAAAAAVAAAAASGALLNNKILCTCSLCRRRVPLRPALQVPLQARGIPGKRGEGVVWCDMCRVQCPPAAVHLPACEGCSGLGASVCILVASASRQRLSLAAHRASHSTRSAHLLSICPQKLIDKLDGDLEYALRHDGKMAPEDCENYAEVSGGGRGG